MSAHTVTFPAAPSKGASLPPPDAPEPDTPLPEASALPDSAPVVFSARYLHRGHATTWSAELQRMVLATGLAAVFGGALGLRKGGLSLLFSALGVPAGILAIAAVAVPALAIVLALANAPLDAMDLIRATSRAAIRAGLLLAGLAPGFALLVVTCEEAVTVDILGFTALLFAGALAAHGFAADLTPSMAKAPARTRAAFGVALPAFLLFATVLAARVWWLALPVLTEVS